MSDILSENDEIVSESSLESSKEVVIKNKGLSQKAKKQLTEKQKLALSENIKKANAKRKELKPVNQQAEKDKQDLKTLERLVRAKEMAARKNELMKRLAELDASIEGAQKVVSDRKKQKAKAVEQKYLEVEPSVDEEVVVKRSKKKVRKIIVEDSPSESEEVVVKKQRKPRTNVQKKDEPKTTKKALGDMALKQAIEQEQTKLLYNQIFGL